MSGDLQATLEFIVEFSKFHNVDLFQRGFYHIRCTLKPPPKTATSVDVEYKKSLEDRRGENCLFPAFVEPSGNSCSAITRTFQILYKNEDVALNDAFVFTLNMLVDSAKVVKQIDGADIQLLVELFFCDTEFGILRPLKGNWLAKGQSNMRISTATFYVSLYGNRAESNSKSRAPIPPNKQTRYPFEIHRIVCTTLLSVQVNLLAYFQSLLEFLPENQRIPVGFVDSEERLDALSVGLESLADKDEVFSRICSDFSILSSEISLVWSQFQEFFILNKHILPHLQTEHHRQRVGHLSEAFFLQEYPLEELATQQQPNSFQVHQNLAQSIRNSKYYQNIPALNVECPLLDGDSTSIPIVFEERFSLWPSSKKKTTPTAVDAFSFDEEVGTDSESGSSENQQLILNDIIACREAEMKLLPHAHENNINHTGQVNQACLGQILPPKDEPSASSKLCSEISNEQSFEYLQKMEKERGKEKQKDTASLEDIDIDLSPESALTGSTESSLRDSGESEDENNCSTEQRSELVQPVGKETTVDSSIDVGDNKESDTTTRNGCSDVRIPQTDPDTVINSGSDQENPPKSCEYLETLHMITRETNLCEDISEGENSIPSLGSSNCVNKDKEVLDETISENHMTLTAGEEREKSDSGPESALSDGEECKEQLDKKKESEADAVTVDVVKNDAVSNLTGDSKEIVSVDDNVVDSSDGAAVDAAHTCDVEDEAGDADNVARVEEEDVTNQELGDAVTAMAAAVAAAAEAVAERAAEAVAAAVEAVAAASGVEVAASTSGTGTLKSPADIATTEEETIVNATKSPTAIVASTKPEVMKTGIGAMAVQDLPASGRETKGEEARSKPVYNIDMTKQNTESTTSLVTNSNSTTQESGTSSSVYETPLSSETSLSTYGSWTDINLPPPAEGNTTRNSVSGCPAAGSSSKSKKVRKSTSGKSLSTLGACFPMACAAGNTSPTFSLARGNSVYGGAVRSRFELAKADIKRSLAYPCHIYSELPSPNELEPYFSSQQPDSMETHLIVCVHGLDGNSGDLRLLRCYLEMALPSTRLDFLMSEVNQPDTFVGFEEMTDKLVSEIKHYIEAYTLFPSKISFIGHSLGNIIIRSALTHREMEPYLEKLHTLLSLSGPHLGMLYHTSSLVSTGLWFMQKWKKSESLLQLSLHDMPDPRQTFIYRLSQSKGFEYFSNVLLVSSVQDHYVPFHSARIEPCKASMKDNSEYGVVYREMIDNLLKPLGNKPSMNFVRYSVFHAIPSSANSFIGRAAHIAMLDSDFFIEKLLLVSAVGFFR